MPAPLDVDWSGIRAAAVAIGNVSEAARQAASNLPPEERARFREAVSKRAVREQWITEAEAIVSKVVSNPTLAVQGMSKALSNRVQTGADTLSSVLREDGNATKLAGMRYARRVVTHAADLADPEQALASAPLVKAALQSAAIAGDWQAARDLPSTVINIALLGRSLDDLGEGGPIDV